MLDDTVLVWPVVTTVEPCDNHAMCLPLRYDECETVTTREHDGNAVNMAAVDHNNKRA